MDAPKADHRAARQIIALLIACLLLLSMPIHLASHVAAPTFTSTFYLPLIRGSGPTGKIAMNLLGTSPGVPNQIAVLDVATFTLKTLSTGFGPSWSPDGTKIAFVDRRANAVGDTLYVMLADGSQQTNLSQTLAWSETPRWSPDGTTILFEATPDPSTRYWAIINADGSDERHLFGSGEGDDPVWSPDGAQIAFAGSNHAIYLMLADGSGTRQLTTSTFAYPTPRWSPDGTKIAFLDAPNGYAAIFSINADGSGLQQLTDGRTDCYEPVWSPDSTKIAYQEDVVWAADIMVMNADGSDPRSLGGGNARPPIWSPDARYVAFPLLDGNMGGLYAVSLDGAERLNVTRAAGWYYPVINPQWRE